MDYIISKEVKRKLRRLDYMTYNHCIRTRDIAKGFEQKFDIDGNVLSQAAYVHDIGKIYIPSKIIGKPGPLTKLEREIIDLHPYYSYRLLHDLGVNEKICQIALFHHSLSPPTLSSIDIEVTEEIKQYAIMLHTIDSYEALTTDRSYRRGFAQTKALEIMDKESGHDLYVLDFLHANKVM